MRKLFYIIVVIQFCISCENNPVEFEKNSIYPNIQDVKESYETFNLNPQIASITGYGGFNERFFIHGEYAYIRDDNNFFVLSISDTYNPLLVNSKNFGSSGTLRIKNNRAYVGNYNYWDKFKILDISDPQNLFPIGELENGNTVDGLDVYNNIVCLNVWRPGPPADAIEIIDIADESNPIRTSVVDINIDRGWDVKMVDEFLYCHSSELMDHYIQIFNISDIYNPILIKTIQIYPDDPSRFRPWFKTYPEYPNVLFLGELIFDISSVDSPTLIANVDPGAVHDVDVQGNLLVASIGNYIKFYDISNLSKPLEIQIFQMGYANGFSIYAEEGIYIRGRYVYILTAQHGMVIIDLNNTVEVFLDIKPGSCPNPINTKSKGVIPVAILGGEKFDVNNIDPNSILLEGVKPIHWNYDDVSAPFVRQKECDCTTGDTDSFNDLSLKFDTQEVVSKLGIIDDGDTISLTVTGLLTDGTQIEGKDCVVIKK